MALLFGIETVEGGSLPGSFTSASVSFGPATITADATSKVKDVYSVKFANTGEAGLSALATLGADKSELWISIYGFLPAGFVFGVSSYCGWMSIRDNADADRITMNIEDFGAPRLTISGDVSYTDTGINLPVGSVFRLEIYIKKSATVGEIKVWLNNAVSGSPDYSATGLNTGAAAMRKVAFGKTYVPEAVSDYYMDNFAIGDAFIGETQASLEQEGYRWRADDGSESAATWLASQDTIISRAKNTVTRVRLLLNAALDYAASLFQLDYRKKDYGERWKKVLTANTPAGTEVLPTWVAAGTSAGGTGAITPGVPAGVQYGDLLVMFVNTENENATTPAGWTEFPDSPQGIGTAANAAATRLEVYWKRAADTEPATYSVGDAGDHTYAQIVAFRGVLDTGNPYDVTSGGTEAADTSLSATGDTTTVANCLILIACAHEIDSAGAQFSGWANSDLANILERIDEGTTAADGGGVGMATGEKAAAGSYGATTATVAASTQKAFITIALKPQPAAPGVHTFLNKVRFTNNTDATEQDFDVGEGATVVVLTIISDGATTRTGVITDIPSFGGRPMTQGDVDRGGAAGYETGVQLWYLIDPPPGISTVSIPNAGTLALKCVLSSYKAGVGYTSAYDTATGGAATSGADPSASITPTVDGALIVGVLGCGLLTAPTARTSQVLYETDDGAFTDSHQYHRQYKAGAYTMGWTVGSDDRAFCIVAFKPVALANAFLMAASSNITASGENTTVQLTAPSGKSTSDFVAGRIQDDENPADSVNITIDDYTEMEYSIKATDDA